MATRTPIDTKHLLQITLIAFAIIEGLSYLLSQLGVIDFISGGFFLIIILVVIFLSTLFNLGTNISSLKTRDIALMIIVLVLVVALYFILPLAIPSVFSIFSSQEVRDNLVHSLASVAGISTGVA
jgi:hypothetical protein